MGCSNSKNTSRDQPANASDASAQRSRRASNVDNDERIGLRAANAPAPAPVLAIAGSGGQSSGMNDPTAAEGTDLPIKRALVLHNSISGGFSVSNQGIEKAMRSLKATFPKMEVVERNLVKQQVPFLTDETAEAIRNHVLETENQKAADALATELIEEIKSTDLLLIGLPRYNFGTPTSFKTYLDYIARPRITFQYGANGPEGLLPNIPVWIVMSADDIHGDDYYSEWLNTVLPFIGLKHLKLMRIEGTATTTDESVYHTFNGALLDNLKELMVLWGRPHSANE